MVKAEEVEHGQELKRMHQNRHRGHRLVHVLDAADELRLTHYALFSYAAHGCVPGETSACTRDT